MKKLTKNLLSIMLACLLFVGGIQFSTNRKAEASGIGEQKIYSTATVEDNFATDSVIVVMKKSESEVNKVYAPSYFNCDDVVSVQDLTYITGNVNEKKYLNEDNFHQILKVYIRGETKADVMSAISEIQTHSQVLIADVNTEDLILIPPPIKEDEENQEEQEETTTPFWSHQKSIVGGTDCETAWEYTLGSEDIQVGVVDSGVSPCALMTNVSAGKDCTVLDGYANNDISGHGTMVASVIGGGVDENGRRIGVSSDVEIVPLNIKKQNPNGGEEIDFSAVIVAIHYAISSNIPILNFSIGGPKNEDICRFALGNYLGLCVCAAGNKSKNNDIENMFPANFANENCEEYDNISERVLSVGANSFNGEVLVSSHYGENSVSIFAPGEAIAVVNKYGVYTTEHGTSLAAPHVTGVAALLLSINPDLTAEQLKDIIMASARIPVDANGNRMLAGMCVSEGIVNAYNAVKYLFNNYGDSVNLNGTDVTFTKTIDSNETIYNKRAIMLKLSTVAIARYKITITSTNALKITVRGATLNENINVIPSYSEDKKTATISGTMAANAVQYLEIEYESATASGTISINKHLHDYTHSYQRYTLAQHKSLCACGAYILSSHAVSITATGRYKPCLACGELIDTGAGGGIGGGLHPGNISQLVTVNGSYVLPNGVIVLVDEDIAAYFAGTLKFYKKDELPENI